VRKVWIFALLLAAPSRALAFQKVMIVIFENTGFDEALSQPFFKRVAAQGAVLTNYRAVAHPSQPNYVALVAGTTRGVVDDRNVDLDLRHLGDLLEARGKTWKVYAEGYPGNCFLGAQHGRYVRKHVPFLSFKNVQTNPERCAKIVEADQLFADVRSGSLPDYSMVVPDLDDDGHDTGAEFADRWFERRFGPLLADPAFTQELLFVATFDEDDRMGGNRVYTALVGPAIRPGLVSNAPYTHYSLLRTVEDAFGLGTLGRDDAHARSIASLWTKSNRRKSNQPRLRHCFHPLETLPALPR